MLKEGKMTKEEKNLFSIMIQTLAHQKSMSHMDAIVYHCEQTGLEIEVAAKLVDESLKSKLEMEAKELGYIQRTSQLPGI